MNLTAATLQNILEMVGLIPTRRNPLCPASVTGADLAVESRCIRGQHGRNRQELGYEADWHTAIAVYLFVASDSALLEASSFLPARSLVSTEETELVITSRRNGRYLCLRSIVEWRARLSSYPSVIKTMALQLIVGST